MSKTAALIAAAVRTSEFWALAAQAYLEVSQAPVPQQFQDMGWVYIVFRVGGKLARFIFPNPANPDGAWLKQD